MLLEWTVFFMVENKRLKTWELAALIALCVTLCVGLWARGRQAEVSGKLIRLRVVAVSDAPEEQQIKLRVRDAVLAYLEPKLRDAGSAEEAQAVLLAETENIRAAAESAAGGRPVRVELTDERIPTRRYGGVTLPAGRYRALRITLGEGQGQNWWCIVFPPVCLSAVEEDALRPVMGPEDYALLTRQEGWELRFRCVELWGELLNALHGVNAKSHGG